MGTITRYLGRNRRHERLRKVVNGSGERPRLAVYRSLSHIYAQIIDDSSGVTLVAASTTEKDLRGTLKHAGNKGAAEKVGELIAKRATDKKIKKVVFDRGGYRYHGRVAALADAARKAGLEF